MFVQTHICRFIICLFVSCYVSSRINMASEQELKYGWLSFKPRWLQAVNNCKCFLLVVVILSFAQGLLPLIRLFF